MKGMKRQTTWYWCQRFDNIKWFGNRKERLYYKTITHELHDALKAKI